MARRRPPPESPPPDAAPTPDPPHVVATIPELAAALGIKSRMVQYCLAEGMPGEPGRYDVAAAREWREANKQIAGEGRTPQSRLAAARAEREELKLARDRGELLPAAEVSAFIVAHVSECRAHLEELPPAIAAALPEELPDQVRAAVRDSLHRQVQRCLDTLAELARQRGQEKDEGGWMKDEAAAPVAPPDIPRGKKRPPKPTTKPKPRRKKQ